MSLIIYEISSLEIKIRLMLMRLKKISKEINWTEKIRILALLIFNSIKNVEFMQ
jgi:hypothetical protein